MNDSSFPIPNEALAAIRRLLDLGQEGITQLQHAIECTGPSLAGPDERTIRVQQALGTGIAVSDVQAILANVVGPLRYLREQFGTADELHAYLTHVLQHADREGWPEEYSRRWQDLRQEVVALLDSATLNIESKARELVGMRARWVQWVRILSDLRPVFDENAERTTAMVLVNTLVIGYRAEDSERVSYFDLDPGDLERLSSQIARARQKNDRLKQELVAAQKPVLYYEDTQSQEGGRGGSLDG